MATKQRTSPASRSGPTFEVEAAALARGQGPVAGIDEAGRGPWAGPVVAAAVILVPGNIPPGLDDSKALDATTRAVFFDLIHASGAEIGVGIADVAAIDRLNILGATMSAMQQAVAALAVAPMLAIVDGNRAPRLACVTETLVGGDARCLSIAAASIIAKVTRDRMMEAIGLELPGYGFERHKGYGTPQHQEALASLGVSAHHRRSFRPIRIALDLEIE